MEPVQNVRFYVSMEMERQSAGIGWQKEAGKIKSFQNLNLIATDGYT